MRIFLATLPDGSVSLRGLTDPPIRGHLLSTLDKGRSFAGLSYAELIQYAWINTSSNGEFVGGEKLPLADPARQFDIPDFLRTPSR